MSRLIYCFQLIGLPVEVFADNITSIQVVVPPFNGTGSNNVKVAINSCFTLGKFFDLTLYSIAYL